MPERLLAFPLASLPSANDLDSYSTKKTEAEGTPLATHLAVSVPIVLFLLLLYMNGLNRVRPPPALVLWILSSPVNSGTLLQGPFFLLQPSIFPLY